MSSPPIPLWVRLSLCAHKKAKELGHDLEPWERVGDEFVSFCHSCGLAAVVNIYAKETQAYGSTIKVACKGRFLTAPSWAPQI